MKDFSVQKNIEQFYSYKTFKKPDLMKESDLSDYIEFCSSDGNGFFSVLYSGSEKLKSKFIDGFYPIENNSSRWMSKSGLVLIDVPEEANYFFVKGYFPPGFHPEEKLKLSVFVEDLYMGEVMIDDSNGFYGKIPIINSLLRKPRNSVLIKIIASNSFVPAENNSQSGDFRDLSMLIHSLGFLGPDELPSPEDDKQFVDLQIDQPLHPYFSGKCNICGSDGLFIFDNYLMFRESFLCDSCRSSNRIRQLANGLLKYLRNRGLESTFIKDLAVELRDTNITIYDTDSNYHVAHLLKGYNNYITSDYREDVEKGVLLGKNHFCQDLSNLTFNDNSFDVVLSTDVFEHVRLYKHAIKEIFRVLKPGGAYIFTVPFESKIDDHEIFVEVVDDKDSSKDIDRKPRVFHGDTIASSGALLFRIYGKKIFEEFERVGFLVKYERTTIPSIGIYDCDLFTVYKPKNSIGNSQNSLATISGEKIQTDSPKFTECKWLNIELSSICNLRCQWCILDHTKPAVYLGLTELQKVMRQIEVGELPNLERIELHNGGETLLHPKIDEVLEIISDSKAKFSKPIFISLLTNGTVLKETTLQLLASGKVVDEIRISVDGGTIENFEEIRKNAKWSKVSTNVKRFREAINSASSKTKLGIICMVPQGKPDNIEWMEEEFKNVLLLADQLEIRHPHSWEGSLPESSGLVANTSLKNPNRICKFLKNDLVILASGKVTICCADLNGRGIVGDVASNKLEEILSGTQRQKIITLWQEGRFDEIPICSTCEGYYEVDTHHSDIYNTKDSSEVTHSGSKEKLNRIELMKLLQSKLIEEAFCEAQILISKSDPALLKHLEVQDLINTLNNRRELIKKARNWTGKISASKTLQAEKLIEEQKLEVAQDTLVDVVNMEPFHIEALNDLAVVFILQGKNYNAMEILNYIILNDPQNETAAVNRNFLCSKHKEIPIPEISFNKFLSYSDYMYYSHLKYQEFKKREVFEASLLTDGENPFAVKGFCAVCRTEVDFLVDYQYSNELNGKKTPNWRERLVCPKCDLNNRNRAAIHLIQENIKLNDNARLFIAEQTTPLFQYLKENYLNTIGSEYLGEKVALGEIDSNGIRNEDFTNLSFCDYEFDVILCFDVFEHIPDYTKAFIEAYRVLKPGGKLLFTVPFDRNAEKNLTRAIIEGGEIKHLYPPEYHGDPLNVSNGCLCYYHFGWELLGQLKTSGFDAAYVQSFYSKEYGYLGAEQLFVVAEKN